MSYMNKIIELLMEKKPTFEYAQVASAYPHLAAAAETLRLAIEDIHQRNCK